MNFYPHHIGDFRSGTVNMSRLSRWIYRDMIDIYYDTERPLKLEVDLLCDELGAESDEERRIVERLLRMKFVKAEDGYHHERCDEEIAAYRARAEAAKANGQKGGRPKKDPKENPPKPSGFPLGSDSEPNCPQGLAGSQANQEPITNNQEEKQKPKARATRWAAKPPDVPDSTWDGFVGLRKQRRSPVTDEVLADFRAEGQKAGMTLAEVLATCNRRGWQGFEADWLRGSTGPQGRAPPGDAREAGRAAAAASIYGTSSDLDLSHGTRDQEPFTIDV